MKPIGSLGILGLGLTGLAASAAAQVDIAGNRAALRSFAACAVANDRPLVNTMLSTGRGAQDEVDAIETLIASSDCADAASAKGRVADFRGALAEAVLLAEPTRRKAVERRDAVKAVPVADGNDRAYFARLASCVARANPRQSLALVRSEPSTASENGAYKPLATSISRCLPDVSSTKLSRTEMRYHIADALYAMSEAG